MLPSKREKFTRSSIKQKAGILSDAGFFMLLAGKPYQRLGYPEFSISQQAQ